MGKSKNKEENFARVSDALYSQRVLLTGNVKHMSSIEGLKIESI